MDFDPFRIKNVKKETKTELLRWKSQSKPSTPQHIAANVELIQRDDQMRSRLWTCRWSLRLSSGPDDRSTFDGSEEPSYGATNDQQKMMNEKLRAVGFFGDTSKRIR